MKSVGIEAISYVGTTLLSLILGSHPRCHSVGHCFKFFPPYRLRNDHLLKKDNVCSICSLIDAECDLNVLKDANLTNVPLKDVYDVIYSEVLDYDEDIIIDSSSTTPWFDRTKPDHIIWMFRDPVTLASSYVKSMIGGNREHAIKYMCDSYVRKYRRAFGLAIEYRNIVTETDYLRGLFDKIGLEFSADYLEYWNYSNHMVGGNNGVLVNIAKYIVPDKLDYVLDISSKGNATYREHYLSSIKNFSGEINLLTQSECDVVMEKCNPTYIRLKELQECLIT